MSGTENLKGFDYQITFSILKTLQTITSTEENLSFQFESLNEDEEDFNILKVDSHEFYQLKKRNEGNHWTAGDLKNILGKFFLKRAPSTFFFFVTNGTANADVKSLKEFLSDNKELTDEELSNFLPGGCDSSEFKLLLKNTQILTRFFASDDDNDPAKLLRIHVQELLNRPPFDLTQTIDHVYPRIWKVFFDYAREGKRIPIKQIIDNLQQVGIALRINKPWLEIPEIKGFQGRTEEIKIISEKLGQTKKLILYGINGIGKSWITTKILSEQSNGLKSICWIPVSRWMSSERLLSLISYFFYSHGHETEATTYRSLQIAERIPQIISALKRLDFDLVIDSVNSGNAEFIEFIKELLDQIKYVNLTGSLIINSTKRFFHYMESDLENHYLSEYDLPGFTITDMRLILSGNQDFSQEDITLIHEAVGGHPMSIYFLNSLLYHHKLDTSDIEKIKQKTIEGARDWIIEKSISQLSEDSKKHLLTLSVIDGTVSFDEAELLLPSDIIPKYLLRDLRDQNLVYFHHDGLTIHDSIREVALNMLTKKARLSLYLKLADFHFSQMKTQKGTDEGVIYDSILKWGANIEGLSGSEFIPNKYEAILSLEEELLDAIWAISRFGYPFDYKTEDLSYSRAIIEKLITMELVKACDDSERQYGGRKMQYSVDNIDYWQDCLVIYLCLSKGISNHVGYIATFKPNYAFEEQAAIICPWEHCIEYMPLPPITKSEELAHLNFVKSQFKSGAYYDKSFEDKQFLQGMLDRGINEDLPEERDWEMEEKRCPMFGHCCPGGKEQVEICLALDAIDFDDE